MGEKLNLHLENRDTLHLKVCNVLREAIVRGELKPGEKLVQSDLADAMDVSRMPVREALRKLETEGLVTLEPHRGAIVRAIKTEDIVEIYELRSQLEKMAVELSVHRLTDEDIQQLEVYVYQMQATEDVHEFVRFNIEFHKLLIKRCPWNRLLSFISTLWNGFPQHTPHMLSGQIEASNREHHAILTAIQSDEKGKVAKLLEAHIKRTGKKVVQSLR